MGSCAACAAGYEQFAPTYTSHKQWSEKVKALEFDAAECQGRLVEPIIQDAEWA